MLMTYVALLRGINVGGKNKLPMPQLKTLFEALGCANVITYINTGNVVFTNSVLDTETLRLDIEQAIVDHFECIVPVIVCTMERIQSVVAALKDEWVNDAAQKCDVMFLWPKYDTAGVLSKLSYYPQYEDLMYVPGVIIWRVNRDRIKQGQMLKIIGTDLYKYMTIRNVNTVRKIAALMQKISNEVQPT